MLTLIVNPTSGRGAALALLPKIEDILKERGRTYRILRAESSEKATEYARKACLDGDEAVVALGGDGTLFQIANGMAGSSVPMIFVSCGTGNDFVRSLKLPSDPLEALKLQLDSPSVEIDVGRMNDIYFLNVSGTGFDVEVLRYVEKHKKNHKGLSAYMHALYEAVKAYRPMKAMVSIDDGPEESISFALLSIGNGRYIGGGMKAVPDARLNDGLFDIVTVLPVRKFMILPLVAFYVAGKHISMKLASVRRCKKITIRCDGMTLNLDGELRSADYARFELLPGALNVCIPAENL